MNLSKIAFSLFLALALTFAGTTPGRAEDAPYKWKLKRSEDGVEIRVRRVQGSDYLQFSGSVLLNVPLQELLRLYEEHEDGRMPEWFYGCKSVRLMETKSPDEKIFYMVFSMPAPMRDRDIVYSRKRSTDPASGRVVYEIRGLKSSFPKADHKVRMPSIEVTWQLTPTPEGKTQIYYEQHCDIASILPAWLVNAMADEVPYKTLTGLRKITDALNAKRG